MHGCFKPSPEPAKSKLILGFVLYVVLSLLICSDSWTLSSPRNSGVPRSSVSEERVELQHRAWWGSLSVASTELPARRFGSRFYSRESGGLSTGYPPDSTVMPPAPASMRVSESIASKSAAEFHVDSLEFQRGDTFFNAAVRLGLPGNVAAEAVREARGELDMRRIAVGDVLTLKRKNFEDDWFRLEYEKKNEYQVLIEPSDDGFAVQKRLVALTPRIHTVEGVVETSLYESAMKAGLSPALVDRLVNIFCWDVDFLVDVRKGDRFKIVYEKWYRKDSAVRDGTILAARFTNEGRDLEAFLFLEENGEETYYDRQGANLRKQFLKSPLQYTRISSHFSHSRLHPILKIYRPHLGVDYAAPQGTPVQSIGDGKVEFAGWRGGFGNFVKVRHASGLVSCYGHLRGFAGGVRAGRRVKQGQLIGWVGMTGLATGPHLDFRIIQDGKYVDPVRVLKKTPALHAVGERNREAFNRVLARYAPLLDDRKPVFTAMGIMTPPVRIWILP